VRSYLAVPVISRGGEVLGGLFFGHAKPGVFTESHERLVTGIAGWAAVAIENASLYEAERRARQEADTARAEAEHANRAKTDFLATMSHELRTPLNAIAGYVELLQLEIRGPLTSQQHEDLRRIRRSQQHLLALINDVLNLARLEAGNLTLQIDDVPVCPALSDLEVLVGGQAAAKQLSFLVMPCDESLYVRADDERLRQILLNLVTNAVKFTPEGGSVTVRAIPRAEWVEIDVTDTGRGIPRSMHASIFEPFIQLERGTSSEQGIGLGLAISRDLARLMDGDITVRSREGRGSIFTVRLPSGR
jgi:signal transduction histidine kinase